MKFLLTILLFFISASNCFSQFATKAYVDSLFRTLDSIIVRPPKPTLTNNTITLDTLTLPNNASATFQILVQTENDNVVKYVYVRNIGGIYSIIDDTDVKSFSRNKSGIFNSTILYSVSSSIIDNRVIISVKGRSGTIMNWKLSRTKL